MTDSTVSAYYSHPGTLMCERCRAVWRITPNLEGDDLEYMLERYDAHVCDPDVDPAEVEEVRRTAMELADDLPPKPPGGDTPVDQLSGPSDPVFVALGEWHRQVAGLAEILRGRHGPRFALLTTCTPAVIIGDREPWEDVLSHAWGDALREAR